MTGILVVVAVVSVVIGLLVLRHLEEQPRPNPVPVPVRVDDEARPR